MSWLLIQSITINKKKMNYNLQFFKALLITNIFAIVITFIFFNMNTLLNVQVAFVSSSLVMFASMLSYKRMVENRVEAGMIVAHDDRDDIDKLEDPYDLYSEDIESETNDVDLKEVVKEQKAQMKLNKRGIGQTIKDTKAALSFYRIFSYVVLVVGFLYLNRHGMLEIFPYIISLSIPIIVLVSILTKSNK